MENKINIAGILKDCPSGMELDCTMYEDVYFDYVDELNMICCYIQHETCKTYITFNQHGQYVNADFAKCVIFPKGETTWEGFQRPFKNGDIVATRNGTWIGITLGGVPNESIPTYCVITSNKEFEAYFDTKETWGFERLATEEEKQKLFDAIKDNGYKWNAETKTLEKLVKPKFKVGDRIKYRYFDRKVAEVVKIHDKKYELDNGKFIEFQDENAYEISYDKFDITTLKPFDKVLVRHNIDNKWNASLFSFIDEGVNSYCYKFITIAGKSYPMMIPYEGNEHLLGTTKNCDEYYKTW